MQHLPEILSMTSVTIQLCMVCDVKAALSIGHTCQHYMSVYDMYVHKVPGTDIQMVLSYIIGVQFPSCLEKAYTFANSAWFHMRMPQ
jgi:hypothetical protein